MANIEDKLIDEFKEGGDKIDLFQPTEAVAESTAPISRNSELTTDSIHTALQTAGFAPGIGITADLADAALFAFEGEFGNAALSAAAAVPFVGQFVSAKRAIKAAEDAGDEIITLYRSTAWHPKKTGTWGKVYKHDPEDFYNLKKRTYTTRTEIKPTGQSMVKDGKFVGGEYSKFDPRTGDYSLPEGTIWTTTSKKEALIWSRNVDLERLSLSKGGKGSYMLEFQIPKKELSKLDIAIDKRTNFGIKGGLDKKWLVKAEPITPDTFKKFKE